jgi:3-deoxy-D-manno-octulosonic-acid transferase
MKTFWFIFYNWLFIPFFWLLLQIAAFFNAKIQRGVRGRKGLFDQMERDVQKLTSTRRVWFHSSSLGEFEQAKPIIAALRKKYRDINIIVTFFSPSGYDHSKNYKLADIITYIPFDTKTNARRFLDLLKPTAAVFVRYDVWPNHLWELSARNIPAFIANATMRTSSARFYPLMRNFHRLLFNNFESILTVSANDVEAFSRFELTHPSLQAIGETRYDQVWQRSAEARKKHLIPSAILKERKVFIAGSTWPEDEEVLLPTILKLTKYDSKILTILVPHEPTEYALEAIEKQLHSKAKSIRFSLLNDYSRERVILVDSVGILMALYQYADAVYVGGSFRQGIHNVLEPAVYGIPVVYGPRHQNSQEAQELIHRGGGFVVNDQQECYRTLRTLLGNKKANAAAGHAALKLVEENIGATERFIQHLSKVLS